MCFCRSAAAQVPSRPSARAAEPAPDGSLASRVPVTYVGTEQRIVAGPVTGVGYLAYPGEPIAAHPDDAPALIAGGSFQAVA
jgi:hypothetical protein